MARSARLSLKLWIRHSPREGSEEGSHDPEGKPQDANLSVELRKIVCLFILPFKQEYTMIKACPGMSLSGSANPRGRNWIQVDIAKGQTPEDYRQVIVSVLKDLAGVEVSFDSLEIRTGSKMDADRLRRLLGLPRTKTISIVPKPALDLGGIDQEVIWVGAVIYGLYTCGGVWLIIKLATM